MKIRPKRIVLLAVGATVALSSTLLVTQAATAETEPATPPSSIVEWEPCEDAPDIHCGSIEVPLNWDEPEGEKIELALARRAATDPDERLGTIVMNPGGPGGSGVEDVKTDLFITPEVAAKYDYVGFDPRGVGESTPIECRESDLDDMSGYMPPADATEFVALEKANATLAAGCEDLTGPLVDHVDNMQTVHDMDAIRDAVGDEKLNFLGLSFGSMMGQQYAEEYPERVGAMVLDGIMDHSLESTWDFVDSETLAAERNFDAWAA